MKFWKIGWKEKEEEERREKWRGKLFVINKNVFVNYSMLGFVQGTAEVDNRGKKKKRPMK